MPSSPFELDIGELSVSQRLDLIARLWDSIPEEPEAMPVPDSHRREVEARLQAADADPEEALAWDVVREQLRDKT